MQYCYLIGRAKQVNALMIRNLEKLYGEYQDQEVLQILCSVLLSSRRVERKYFRWFAMGVERGLKINGLHEAYMDTVPEEQTTPYDASVYTYFSFDCRLSDRKRALLYSNILQNSRLLPDVAAQYRREITVFTKEMFDKKAMNEFLPVLYRKLYEENQGNRRIVAGLAKLQDRCRITTSYERMRQVIAADESGEHTVPLLQGEAWISLQKENHILLEDKNGVRYGDASYYNITRPFELPGLDEQSMEGQQITLNLPKAVRLPKPVLTVEEKIVRALFTEEGIDRILPDFLNYAAGKCDRKLVKSFLCYYSFRYLYYNNGGNEELFRLLWKEVLYEENEVGRMALLKWMSRKGELTREESQAAGKWIEEFYAMGIILPFFKQLEGRAELPYGISKRYYIEYHANPSRRITVHYSIGKMGEVTEELMPHCYKGIFVKEFILFQDEELYYYITEEGQEETDPKLWKLEPDPYEGEEEISLYGLLNLLAYAREQGDAEQVKSLVEDYHAMRQVLQEKFKII